MGELRIIGGEFRSRRILAPPGRGVRPTADRVREALFDILGDRPRGASVLDAFAGSGALGLEALSRGARSVTFIERDRAVLTRLERNISRLCVEERCRVLAGSVERALRSPLPGRPFDLVLADPPYDLAERGPVLAALGGKGVLSDRARVVLERDLRQGPAEDVTGRLRLIRTARYGRTCLDFYSIEVTSIDTEPTRDTGVESSGRNASGDPDRLPETRS